MHFGQSKTEDVSSSSMTAWVVGALALSFWFQISFQGFLHEYRFGEGGRYLRMMAHFLPLLVFVLAMQTRNLVGLLLIFPLTFLPSLSLLPPIDRQTLMMPWVSLRVVGTMIVYLGLTGAWSSAAKVVPAEKSTTSKMGKGYRDHVNSRVVPMLLLFVVPTYAVFFDVAVVATISQNNPGSELVAQNFVGVLMFFAWCVVAYTMFIVPALNLEYDRRRIRQELEQLARDTNSGKRWVGLGVEAFLVAGGLSVIALVFSG